MLNSLSEGQSQASWLSLSKRCVCQLCREIYFPYDEPGGAASFPTERFLSIPRRTQRIVNGVSERITSHASLATGFQESPWGECLKQNDEIREIGCIFFYFALFSGSLHKQGSFPTILWIHHRLRRSLAFSLHNELGSRRTFFI